MATIINSSPGQPQSNDESGSAGWAVAVIILIAIIGIGAYLLYAKPPAAPTENGGTNINVTVPAGTPDLGNATTNPAY